MPVKIIRALTVYYLSLNAAISFTPGESKMRVRSFVAVTALSFFATSAGQYALVEARGAPPQHVSIVDPIDMSRYAASAHFCAGIVASWLHKAPKTFVKQELNRCYAAELPRV